MFIDAREMPDATTFDCDLCVIGAGAAGIAISREFIGHQAKVIVLEAGGFDFDEATQSLYKGANVGQPYYELNASRLRFFGGTTNHWAGWCRPLDPMDFESKPWIRDSGWPIRYDDMVPFYQRATVLAELPSTDFSMDHWEPRVASVGRRLPLGENRFNSIVFQLSPPTRFGIVYRPDLENAKNVSVYLNANVTALIPSNNGSEILSLKVATLTGRNFEVRPKYVVLACGGIENARVLQISSSVERGGIGNRYDLVGRYFADHVEQVAGYAFFSQPSEPYRWYLGGGSTGLVPALKLNPEKIKARESLGCSITFHSALDMTETSEGFGSLRHILRNVQQGSVPDNLLGHLANIIIDVNTLAGFAYNRLAKTEPQDALWITMNRIEVMPNPDSRVSLSDQKDSLGLPVVKLDWRLSEKDKETVHIAQEELALAFGESGLGRIKTVFRYNAPWPSTTQGGYHHMCTTRMSDDPRRGVVDRDCRVHGVSNLWVAGSSVFASTGTSNPTLTVLALALRLADRLKEMLA